jgi:hypothetical protein
MKPISVKTALCLFLVIFLFGCAKDSTTDPLNTDARTKFLGNWLVRDWWTKQQTYEVTIKADSATSDGVRISNFANSGSAIWANAFVSGNTISLNNNETLSNGWIVNGSGTISASSTITWLYELNTGADLRHDSATFTRN